MEEPLWGVFCCKKPALKNSILTLIPVCLNIRPKKISSLILWLFLSLFVVVLVLPVLMLTVHNFLRQRYAPPQPTHATVLYTSTTASTWSSTWTATNFFSVTTAATKNKKDTDTNNSVTRSMSYSQNINDHFLKFYLKVYITPNTEPEPNTQSFQFQFSFIGLIAETSYNFQPTFNHFVVWGIL